MSRYRCLGVMIDTCLGILSTEDQKEMKIPQANTGQESFSSERFHDALPLAKMNFGRLFQSMNLRIIVFTFEQCPEFRTPNKETNTTGSAKGVIGSIDQIRKRVLYATALNTCEPWEQKLAQCCSRCNTYPILLLLPLSLYPHSIRNDRIR
ncbi:hypothetical protein ACTXT7_008700 [Hymenolepis weldensis]